MSTHFQEATAAGTIELSAGVYLNSKDSIIADQKAWDYCDPCKEIDFEAAPFWITTDSGTKPVSIHDAQDLADYI